MIKLPRIDVADKGGGKVSPTEILPIDMARELCKKYTEDKIVPAAVFWVIGDREPTKEELDVHIAIRDTWMHFKYEQGMSEWARSGKLDMISGDMKHAAKFLHSQGLITDLPDWVVTNKAEQKLHKNECEQCGELNNKAAKICKDCSFPLQLDWVYKTRPDLVALYPALFVGFGAAKVVEAEAVPAQSNKPKTKLPGGASIAE